MGGTPFNRMSSKASAFSDKTEEIKTEEKT